MSAWDPQLRALAHEAKRQRQLPQGTVCVICGTSEQLVNVNGEVRCYEHRTSETAAVELHHLAGQANVPGLVIPFTGNAHRAFHDRERAFGLDAHPDAAGEPLLVLAHVLKGIGLLLVQLAEWLFGYVANRARGLDPGPFPVVA